MHAQMMILKELRVPVWILSVIPVLARSEFESHVLITTYNRHTAAYKALNILKL